MEKIVLISVFIAIIVVVCIAIIISAIIIKTKNIHNSKCKPTNKITNTNLIITSIDNGTCDKCHLLENCDNNVCGVLGIDGYITKIAKQ